MLKAAARKQSQKVSGKYLHGIELELIGYLSFSIACRSHWAKSRFHLSVEKLLQSLPFKFSSCLKFGMLYLYLYGQHVR